MFSGSQGRPVYVRHLDFYGLVVFLRGPRFPNVDPTIEPFESRHDSWLALRSSAKFELLDPPLKIVHDSCGAASPSSGVACITARIPSSVSRTCSWPVS